MQCGLLPFNVVEISIDTMQVVNMSLHRNHINNRKVVIQHLFKVLKFHFIEEGLSVALAQTSVVSVVLVTFGVP